MWKIRRRSIRLPQRPGYIFGAADLHGTESIQGYLQSGWLKRQGMRQTLHPVAFSWKNTWVMSSGDFVECMIYSPLQWHQSIITDNTLIHSRIRDKKRWNNVIPALMCLETFRDRICISTIANILVGAVDSQNDYGRSNRAFCPGSSGQGQHHGSDEAWKEREGPRAVEKRGRGQQRDGCVHAESRAACHTQRRNSSVHK